jgi:hypothetical protein
VPVFFHTGSAPGIHPSELSPRKRFSGRLRLEEPTDRFSCRYTRRRSVEPAQQAAVSGLQPFRESLAAGRVFSTPPAGGSPGFFPSRVSAATWTRISPGLLSRASANPVANHHIRRRLRVSISCRLAPSSFRRLGRNSDGATLIGFPHRHDPEHSSVCPSGLCVRLAPRRTFLPTDRRSLDRNFALPELFRTGC